MTFIPNSNLPQRTQQLYHRAKQLIPGGTHLLSKRPEMFAPDVWPAYFSSASGVHVTDLDQRTYLDMSIMSVGACILGYADPDVDNAVCEAISDGVSSSLNCQEEVALAELLLELHPWFDMCRFARSGGEALSIAVRIARASTEREKILFSGYHGWTDWYLAANLHDPASLDAHLLAGLDPSGVPSGLKGTAIPFFPEDLSSVKKIFADNNNQIAALVMEPARGAKASTSYLSFIKDLCREHGTVLIFDEVTSGFRECVGGIHRLDSVYPDIAVFAKGLSNGYAMSAVVGVESVMKAAQSTFMSSTNWTERIGPTAAIATIQKYLELDVATHIKQSGKQMKQLWSSLSFKHHLDVQITGLDGLPGFSFLSDHSRQMNTYLTSRFIDFNILGFRQYRPSLSHTADHISEYSSCLDTVFGELAAEKHLSDLSTPVHHVGFQRLTRE